MKPKKNPFKVNHVRSIKLKNKAKVFVANLKSLKQISTRKIEEVDGQLKSLQEVVHQTPKAPVQVSKTVPVSQETRDKAKLQILKDYAEALDNEKEALDKFDNMEL